MEGVTVVMVVEALPRMSTAAIHFTLRMCNGTNVVKEWEHRLTRCCHRRCTSSREPVIGQHWRIRLSLESGHVVCDGSKGEFLGEQRNLIGGCCSVITPRDAAGAVRSRATSRRVGIVGQPIRVVGLSSRMNDEELIVAISGSQSIS